MAGTPAQGEINRRVLLVRRPTGIPQPDDFAFDEAPVPPLGDGQFLIRNLYLSVDPAQRGWAADAANYAKPVPLGSVMRALAVGVVVESRHPRFPVGSHAYGWFDWQDFAVAEPSDVLTRFDEPEVALSAYAGVLGINGLTAWLAFHNLGRPARGDTVLVSTAAGAVGSIVGQLAQAAGCRVVGLTGGDDKAELCRSRFGYDVALNYKTGAIEALLADAAPDGLDIFFDNVGGAILDAGLRQMRVGGRVVQCGTASIPSWSPPPEGLRNEREVLTRRLAWSGFVIFDHQPLFGETMGELVAMIRDGTLVYDEDLRRGIESAPEALTDVYSGRNRGKMLIDLGQSVA
ncbi:MAG: NADP-dependent oxidoreductase [Allosphingosinicella sp.]|uniref:NADP-dependent oxidoreductase n=1 Tax=Allosphingosinicella sp. TaxID=2823234 RepID=UPI003943FE21